ncbi:hypothetical protein ACSFA7_23615 [Variovorax sp. LT1R20]|uniref:hypothetical protein n=1 Tax=Variovorax sp. LT1R20 TaxID=3443729 RepID=UPI003F47D596
MAKDQVITVDPGDIRAEAIDNMWCFSPRDDEMNAISEPGLVELLERLIEARRQWLLHHRSSPMTFYCWHDPAARQLRLSLVSSSHGRLPFECALDTSHSLQSIARQVVAADWLNDMYFSTENLGGKDAAEEFAYICNVSVVQLP